jgi:hypothetical protein
MTNHIKTSEPCRSKNVSSRLGISYIKHKHKFLEQAPGHSQAFVARTVLRINVCVLGPHRKHCEAAT